MSHTTNHVIAKFEALDKELAEKLEAAMEVANRLNEFMYRGGVKHGPRLPVPVIAMDETRRDALTLFTAELLDVLCDIPCEL